MTRDSTIRALSAHIVVKTSGGELIYSAARGAPTIISARDYGTAPEPHRNFEATLYLQEVWAP